MAYCQNTSRTPWKLSKFVKQAGSGELLLLDGNVDRMLKHFRSQESQNIPIALLSFFGPRQSGKSFFTNLLAHYLQKEGKVWVTELEASGTPGFSFGSQENDKLLGNFIPDNNSSGIYFWPTLFRISHHSTGDMLVGILHIHHKFDDTDDIEMKTKPLDVLLNIVSSRMIDIIYNGEILTQEVKQAIEEVSLDEIHNHLCSNITYFTRLVPEDWPTHKERQKEDIGTFVISESVEPLHDAAGKTRLTRTQQQVFEKLFRNIVDQSLLKPVSLADGTDLTLGNLKAFFTQMVNLVNRYTNIIISNTDMDEEFSSYESDIVHTTDLSNLQNKTIFSGKNKTSCDTFTNIDSNDALSVALSEFFGKGVQGMQRKHLDSWLDSFFLRDKTLGESLFDAYVADIIHQASRFLTNNNSLQSAVEFYEKIRQEAEKRIGPILNSVEVKLIEFSRRIDNDTKDSAEVELLSEKYKKQILDTSSNKNLLDTIAYIFNRAAYLKNQSVAFTQIVQFYREEICTVTSSNPFMHPNNLNKIQMRLCQVLCNEVEKHLADPSMVSNLMQKLEKLREEFYLHHVTKLKTQMTKVGRLVAKYKGIYETKMNEIMSAGQHETDLEVLHIELEEKITKDFSNKISTEIRQNEPDLHVNTLKFYISESWQKLLLEV